LIAAKPVTGSQLADPYGLPDREHHAMANISHRFGRLTLFGASEVRSGLQHRFGPRPLTVNGRKAC
jgi:hypothetical protein